MGRSWHFFALGARLLVPGPTIPPGVGGLHLYAVHPELQIGPLALMAALPARLLPPLPAQVIALISMTAAGAVFVHYLLRRRPGSPIGQAGLFLGAVVFLPVWATLGWQTGHLDDVLALTAATGAVHFRGRHRILVCAVLLAAAADAKPWAVIFLPLLLDRAVSRRQQGAATLVFGAGVLLAWLPFVLGDPATLSALASFTIPVASDSVLRAVGVTAAQTPGWDRPAQIVLAVTLGVLAVQRERGYAVPMIAIAVRLLLDPQTQSYYSAGLLVGTLLFDLGTRRFRLPWATLLAGCLIALPHSLVALPLFARSAPVAGDLRLVGTVSLILTAFAVVPGAAWSGSADPAKPSTTGPWERPGRRRLSSDRATGRSVVAGLLVVDVPSRVGVSARAVRRTGLGRGALRRRLRGGLRGRGPGVRSGLVTLLGALLGSRRRSRGSGRLGGRRVGDPCAHAQDGHGRDGRQPELARNLRHG